MPSSPIFSRLLCNFAPLDPLRPNRRSSAVLQPLTPASFLKAVSGLRHPSSLLTAHRVNKPYLPIAVGDLSVQSAWLLMLFFASVGLLIVAFNFGPFISSLYSIGLLLGTLYSVPPFRLKRYPVAAFLIIATVRGFLLNFDVYYATRAALGLPFNWSSPIAFITAFVTLFALVIALTKDLPDVEGDRQYFGIPVSYTPWSDGM